MALSRLILLVSDTGLSRRLHIINHINTLDVITCCAKHRMTNDLTWSFPMVINYKCKTDQPLPVIENLLIKDSKMEDLLAEIVIRIILNSR